MRTLIARDFARAFERCDVLLDADGAHAGVPARRAVNDPLAMYMQDIFTLAAEPRRPAGAGVPCGLSPAGLPLGCS